MRRELGQIESATLGFNGGGPFTSFLNFNFGGSGQGFGGYSIDITYIEGILNAVGVEDWGDLVGKEMWVERESDDWGARIIAIEAPKYRKVGGRFDATEWAKKFQEK